jgi:hypothetical protein
MRGAFAPTALSGKACRPESCRYQFRPARRAATFAPERSSLTAHGNEIERIQCKASIIWTSTADSEKTLANRKNRAHGVPNEEQPCRFGAVDGAEVAMTTRSRRETITFRHPFLIKGVDRSLPAGDYEVVTDEEMIEGLSFPAYRRVATMIMVPSAPPRSSAMEMISIGSVDLSDAQRIDACTPSE